MAIRELYIAGIGPFEYDDEIYPEAIITDGVIKGDIPLASVAPIANVEVSSTVDDTVTDLNDVNARLEQVQISLNALRDKQNQIITALRQLGYIQT